MEELVLIKKEEHIATITLNRPECGNALDYDMYMALRAAFDDCENDSSVKAIVLTGAGKNFCAGGNIRDFKERIATGTYIEEKEAKLAADTGYKIRNCTKPVIAMVNHAAAGAGCSIACACDFRIVTPSSAFIMAFVNVALPGDTDGLYFLAKLAGITKAEEMMMTGRPVGGEEAYACGLATKVAEESALSEVTYKLAKRLAFGPSKAIAYQKQLFNQYFYNEQLKAFGEDEAKATMDCSRSDDFKEAVNAFLEKRTPVFTGK